MFKAPAIYFPSSVVFLDDDYLYAKMIVHRLGMPEIKHFESPEFLMDQKGNDFLYLDNPAENFDLKPSLSKLKASGTLISVIVSDLHMEIYSGLEIFSQIVSPHVGRILASNFIDHQGSKHVIDAQNSGHIDITLDKTKDFLTELPKAIRAAKNKFFTGLSNLLYSDATFGHPLSDTDFAKFYLSKIEEFKPKEIRPNSTFTRFAFIGEKNAPNMMLHITDEKEIQSNLTSPAAKTAPSGLKSHLSSGKYMLCHEEQNGALPDGHLWPLFVRPAKEFQGKNKRFFYHISEMDHAVAHISQASDSIGQQL